MVGGFPWKDLYRAKDLIVMMLTATQTLLFIPPVKQRLTLTLNLTLVDFQKAFDMINHDVLLQQLSNLGIRNQNLEWFRSYFQNLQIAVRNGQSISDFKPITKGTPQGSSLSGLLFSIYINLGTNILKHCKAIFFTDDLI
jgi:hypothetical protein